MLSVDTNYLKVVFARISSLYIPFLSNVSVKETFSQGYIKITLIQLLFHLVEFDMTSSC